MLKTLKREVKIALGLAERLRPVREKPAPFDVPAFRARTTRLRDAFVRHHALEIIDKGYTVVTEAVSSALVQQAIDAFTAWKKRNETKFLPSFYRADGYLDRVVNIHGTLEPFRNLFTQNRALVVQDYLFQAQTVLYTSLFFEAGSAQDPHRDTPLFWTNPPNRYFGTWVALEDTDADNGPLLVIAGSHKLPLLDRHAMAAARYDDPNKIRQLDEGLWVDYQGEIGRRCASAGLQPTEVHVRARDAIIWHPLLVHGGSPIRDARRTRRSLVVHTTPIRTPVFKTDVFFNVHRPVPRRALWSYDDIGGRSMMHVDSLYVGHSHPTFDFASLR